MPEDIIFEPIEKISIKDKKTFQLELTFEELDMLGELAEHWKNSKAGAMRYSIKYCHREFVGKNE